jgi:hypothetical protein
MPIQRVSCVLFGELVTRGQVYDASAYDTGSEEAGQEAEDVDQYSGNRALL